MSNKNSSDKADRNITALNRWFRDTFKISDRQLVDKLVNSFCSDKGFKVPRALRNSSKHIRIKRLKYNFAVNKFSEFRNFIAAYMTIADEMAKAKAASEGKEPEIKDEGKQLIDSLIKF